MVGFILAFLKYIYGSVLPFLKCTDGSVWSHLNGSTSGFPLNLLPPDFHSQGIMLVFDIMQESNKTSNLKYTDISLHSDVPDKQISLNLVVFNNQMFLFILVPDNCSILLFFIDSCWGHLNCVHFGG